MILPACGANTSLFSTFVASLAVWKECTEVYAVVALKTKLFIVCLVYPKNLGYKNLFYWTLHIFLLYTTCYSVNHFSSLTVLALDEAIDFGLDSLEGLGEISVVGFELDEAFNQGFCFGVVGFDCVDSCGHRVNVFCQRSKFSSKPKISK